MIKIKKPKLCYAINEYNTETDTHYKAIYELIEEISTEMDVFLILEKKMSPVNLNVKKVYVSKFKFFLFKWIELFIVTLYARILGYNRFYSHYTTFSRLNFAIVSRLFFGKSYHWHCGIMKLFWKEKIENFADLKNKLLIEWPERIAWSWNNYLVTGNKSMKRIYFKDYRVPLQKIIVLPNWIDKKRFNAEKYNREELLKKYNLPKEKKIILFVHRIVERKGAHYIIPIYENIKKIFKDAIVLVIGDGPYLDTLKSEISKKKLSEEVVIFGRIPNSELPGYFAISDLFIMPSEEEGFPRVLLESMGMGVPYVASDVGGVYEISPKILREYVVKIGDIKTFAKKCIKLMDKKQELAPKLIKYINENYSKEVAFKRFIKLF